MIHTISEISLPIHSIHSVGCVDNVHGIYSIHLVHFIASSSSQIRNEPGFEPFRTRLSLLIRRRHTVSPMIEEFRRLKKWATHSSALSFSHIASSFACSAPLASLAPRRALSFARSLTRGKVNDVSKRPGCVPQCRFRLHVGRSLRFRYRSFRRYFRFRCRSFADVSTR